MKRLCTWVAFLAIAVGALVTPAAASADDNLTGQHIWNGAYMAPAGTETVTWAENYGNSTPMSENPFDSRLGDSARYQLMSDFETVLGVCDTTNRIGCLQDVEYSLDKGATWSPAKLLESPGQRSFKFGGMDWNDKSARAYTSIYDSDASRGMFKAVLPNYWELPGATNSLGDHYFINAVASNQEINGHATLTGINFIATAGEVTQTNSDCSTSMYNGLWNIMTSEENGAAWHGYCFESI